MTDTTETETGTIALTANKCRVVGCGRPAHTRKYLDVTDPDTGANTGVLDEVWLCRTPGEDKSHDKIRLRDLPSRIDDDVHVAPPSEAPDKGVALGSPGMLMRQGGDALTVFVEGVPKGHTFRALSVPDGVWDAAKHRAAEENRSLASVIVGCLREFGADEQNQAKP